MSVSRLSPTMHSRPRATPWRSQMRSTRRGEGLPQTMGSRFVQPRIAPTIAPVPAHIWSCVMFPSGKSAMLPTSSVGTSGVSLCAPITILLACTFLGVKYVEYTHKIHDCLLPGDYYGLPERDDAGNLMMDENDPTRPKYAEHCTIAREDQIPGKPALFFALYFVMTGMHGLHVLIGVGVLLWIFFRSRRGDFGPKYFSPVEYTGLYWHLVDLIWIFLFPLLYLVK